MDKQIWDKNNTTREKTYYEILECSQNSSAAEVRKNYQHLIRKYHPDKQGSTSSTSEEFIAIDKAYKTLSDEQSRKQYDASLIEKDFDEHFLIHVKLSKEELEFNGDDIALCPCRCGDNFEVHKKDLTEEQVYIAECFQCSNRILIK